MKFFFALLALAVTGSLLNAAPIKVVCTTGMVADVVRNGVVIGWK